MVEDQKHKERTGIDSGLVVMFLKMSIEERLQANDQAIQAIRELRSGYKKKNIDSTGPRRSD